KVFKDRSPFKKDNASQTPQHLRNGAIPRNRRYKARCGDLTKKGDETIKARSNILKEHLNKARIDLVKHQKEVQLLEWKTYQLQQKSR
ncbi:MAG: hypothetical protein IJJ19_08935, partial [Erysipelotrichaceae bacterium]|nr:hypothetical protein [Erysipelotrichaceae bacterium]